ncbi:neuronal acetylcholine receptor subunit eat-2-like [Pectinophora gossypiella]|uniref:neuronal acetylcholine receptor subunit eat-2-like n=1 Tax=Pectinophora gossypiella TaxID=13191 RepID=UPI00214EE93E|nr:neuronal acetylcholine receptor subunit eat-2-like [Pectinophora gossypiella]
MERVVTLILWQLLISCVFAENFTFTYPMALRCKEHLCQHGYSYETFYEVDAVDRRKTKEAAFEMHLAILASSNGHILLSTIPHPEASDPVYEIVVGGGGNKFTELRRNLRRNAKTSEKTVGILSPIDFRAFYIRMSEDGVIEFGKEGEALPILSYNDVDPLTIKYFSFAAWNGVEAKFLYDCPNPNDNSTDAPDSQEVEPKLSNSEQLKRTLLMDRPPNQPPGPTVNVKIDFSVTSVKYDALDSKLTTGLAVVAVWTDDSMAWNPSKFNGTTSLKFRQGQIWRPTFFVFNSDNTDIMNSKNTELISMVYSGEATFHFQSKITTWCYETETMNRWPNDEYSCSILIGAWEPHETITLEGLSTKNNKLNVFADIDDIVTNEWDMDVKIGVVPITVWSKLFVQMDNQTHQSDRLLLTLQLKRRASALNIVFYTPLLVLVTFVLLSFWNEPLQMSRVWFYAVCTAVICMGLSNVDYLVPCHSVPSIFILYTTVLMGVLIALLVQVVLMTSLVQRLCKTVFMQNILTAQWFRTVFCLPVMKTCKNYESINEGYASQEDDDSGVIVAPRNGPVEEMQAEATKYGEREELAEAIDKLMFTVYSITFGVMLALHY